MNYCRTHSESTTDELVHGEEQDDNCGIRDPPTQDEMGDGARFINQFCGLCSGHKKDSLFVLLRE